MLVVRTPLRISLGGGGTDIPAYYRERGYGFLVGAAVTKYVYVAAHENFEQDFLLKYSSIERASSVQSIKHPIFREVLSNSNLSPEWEFTSFADIPAGTGLGSSGSFTVGLIRLVESLSGVSSSQSELAEAACDVEINRLRHPIGKQDQYLAAWGGLRAFRFNADNSVETFSPNLSSTFRAKLSEGLVLYYTGIRRDASEQLSGLSPSNNKAQLKSLDKSREIGFKLFDALESEDLASFGNLLTEQWNVKMSRDNTPLHQEVDVWIRAGISAGALGGKLVGAGGGGFLLFYTENKLALREAICAFGLREVSINIEPAGSEVVSW